MSPSVPTAPPAGVTELPGGDKGLKGGALGLMSSVVIGVASTAPAYSLAATIGAVALAVGLQSPAVMILAFLPMLFIAVAYQRAQPGRPRLRHDVHLGDPGVRAAHRVDGRLGHRGRRRHRHGQPGEIAGQYGFLLFGLDSLAEQHLRDDSRSGSCGSC